MQTIKIQEKLNHYFEYKVKQTLIDIMNVE